VYAEVINFYEQIYMAQEQAKKDLVSTPFKSAKPGIEAGLKEGFPLLDKPEIPVDVPSSVALFKKLLEIDRHVNQKLSQNIETIEYAIRSKNLDIGELVRRHSDEIYRDEIAMHAGIDRSILKFLVHMSIQPSLQILGDQIKDTVDTGSWLRGYCPVCGTLPQVSALRGEGQRFFLCSFCSFEWQSERLKCPFCENNDHQTLHYFYAEGDEACRVDLCEKCKTYIKTIDTRKLSYEPDLHLEDIATIHLDILASEKGFSRPASSPWGME
jgi:FdhE protein